MSKFTKTLGGISDPAKQPESFIPPPPSRDDLRPSRAPRGARTPSLGQVMPDLGELPPNAAPWMKRARRLVLALEHAISGEHIQKAEMAALERAWAAYELDGVSDEVIAKVAHLCERAHGAIRQRFKGSAQEAYAACSAVLWAGLPRGVRKNLEEDELIEIVKAIRGEADAWAAVVSATSQILRWDLRAQQHAAQAVRAALDNQA